MKKSPTGKADTQLKAVEEKKQNVQQLETQIKENMENIEAKMRETQNKMKMLEREKDLMQKK